MYTIESKQLNQDKSEQNNEDVQNKLIKQSSILTDEVLVESNIDEDERIRLEAQQRQKRIQDIINKHTTQPNIDQNNTTNDVSDSDRLKPNTEECKYEISSSGSGNKLDKMDQEKVELLRTLDEERERLNAMVTEELKETHNKNSEK